MLRMSQERDIILKIRQRVDKADKLKDILEVTQASEGQAEQRIYLASPQKKLKLSKFAKHFKEDPFFSNFTAQLAAFLTQHLEEEVSPLEVCSCQVCNLTVLIYSSAKFLLNRLHHIMLFVLNIPLSRMVVDCKTLHMFARIGDTQALDMTVSCTLALKSGLHRF